MFWTGIALVVFGGIIGVSRVRTGLRSAWATSEPLRSRWAAPSDLALDAVALSILVMGVALGAVGHQRELDANARLGQEVAGLNGETAALSGRVAELESRSASLIDENSALATRLSEIEAETERIADYYGTAATWDFSGGTSLGVGPSVGGVGNWRKGFVITDDNGDVSWKCGPGGLAHYRRVIEMHPKFPFPYYLLAVCLLDEDRDDWRTVARAGLQVAERTTSVPSHDLAHDEVLDKLRILLRDGRGTNGSYGLARKGT